MDLLNKKCIPCEVGGEALDDKVNIELTTHAVKGLTENDFMVAMKIDKMYTNLI